MKCIDCKYYDAVSCCRRYPPSHNHKFPPVNSDDWCGEHEFKGEVPKFEVEIDHSNPFAEEV